MPIERVYDSEIEAAAPDFPHLDVADVNGTRKLIRDLNEEAMAAGFQRNTDSRVEEIEQEIPGQHGDPAIPIRIYMPIGRETSGPGFLSIHGGGFFMGDIESEHDRCLTLAAEENAVCVGVDYRLAPENPFPAGAEDCYKALEWVAANASELKIDPGKIVVGGSSAGGNLSAVVALMARDRDGPDISFQMLFYPVVDDRCETPSMKAGSDLYIWDYQNTLDMWNHYLGADRSKVSPYAAPSRAKDLSGLPPAYVMTCEHDPLRDEAIVFAMRLMAAGVPVELHNYPGTVHAFDLLIPSEISTRANQETLAAFRRAVGG